MKESPTSLDLKPLDIAQSSVAIKKQSQDHRLSSDAPNLIDVGTNSISVGRKVARLYLPSVPQAPLQAEVTENLNWHYEYDPLYRLTYACSDWDDVGLMCKVGADEYSYAYDAFSNRTSQTINGVTTNYSNDAANRLTDVDGVTYSWDNNGILTSDGVFTYGYDDANRLVSMTDGVDTYTYTYNGLGDRVKQTVNGVTTTYVLDLNTRYTQVLSDGTNTYLYGVGRIGEEGTAWNYHLGDALGSVRQLADSAGTVSYARTYQSFGEIANAYGSGSSSYGFTGEMIDPSGMVYLRARYYAPGTGRFISRDVWEGDPMQPKGYNLWLYAYSNPVMFTDPSGEFGLTFLAIAGIGATIGGVVEAGSQVVEQWDSNLSLIDNVTSTDYDWAKIGGAAVGVAAFGVLSTIAGGAIFAATASSATTLGAGVTAITTGGGNFFTASMGGMIGGALSTPFSAFTESAIHQKFSTGSFSGSMNYAYNSGMLHPNIWANNAFAGGVAGVSGLVFQNILSSLTKVSTSMSGKPWPVTTRGYGESKLAFACRQFFGNLKSTTGYVSVVNGAFEIGEEVIQNSSLSIFEKLQRSPVQQ